MLKLLLVLTGLALGCCYVDSYFGTVDTQKYKDDPQRLNGFILCMLKVAPCKGQEVEIQGTAYDIIATSCGFCNDDEKAVIHDLISMIAQRDSLFLKAIFLIYDSDPKHDEKFVRSINTFSTKANIPNIQNSTLKELFPNS